MLKLKNVSKFYYNKGVIASGFSKINLEFELGEFVAITGESGSGKSTLLNVLAGLDSYEEGEMYINGEETSHYNEKDLEDYRKKYIGNIFQAFNLVNSYTVYQNIELVLLLNGENKRDIQEKIINIIKEVGLIKYKKTKVSKLSGGQKQRVAIARALAKDTPIILADEPTGNLDSKAATSVLKLLSEVAKDKLVIIVTHNYEQIEEYATRKIKMHDGNILEDKKLKDYSKVTAPKINNFKQISFLNQLRLGVRNTFNVIPKFLLLMIVYLFLSIGVISEYASFKEQDYNNSLGGWNQYFNNVVPERIVIKKLDKTPFTKLDYEKIEKLSNVNYITENDASLDTQLSINIGEYFIGAYANNLKTFTGKVDKGVMPKADNEVIVTAYKNDYMFKNEYDSILNRETEVENGNIGGKVLSYKIKIVGISYTEDYHSKIFASNKVMNDIRYSSNKIYSNLESTLNNKVLKNENNNNLYNIIISPNVTKGNVYIPEDLNYLCPNMNCKNNKLDINISNLYFSDKLNLTINNIYNKNNFKSITGLTDYEQYNGIFFINEDDYRSLYNKENYQSSVFVKDAKIAKETVKELNKLKLDSLYLIDALHNPMEELTAMFVVIQVILIGILVVSMFMISYFIIKIILKSRNIYFSTIRILGASKKVSKRLLEIELFTIATLSYLFVLIVIGLILNGIIGSKGIYEMLTYLKFSDYIILYIILALTSYLLAIRFAKGLFKQSAMNTFREEV
ncbi:MAG: ABC transporter ATP-binding protein [Bacilli bacterium]